MDEADIKAAPETLGRVTSVVPKNREYAADLSGMVDQVLTAFPGFRARQVKPMRIEQCAILNVQGELEECPRTRGTKDLGGSAAIPDGLVVADARIVIVPGLFQNAECVLVAQQPVRPDADP